MGWPGPVTAMPAHVAGDVVACRAAWLTARCGGRRRGATTLVADLHHVDLVEVDDVNHYSIVFAPQGVAAIVDAVRSHLA